MTSSLDYTQLNLSNDHDDVYHTDGTWGYRQTRDWLEIVVDSKTVMIRYQYIERIEIERMYTSKYKLKIYIDGRADSTDFIGPFQVMMDLRKCLLETIQETIQETIEFNESIQNNSKLSFMQAI